MITITRLLAARLRRVLMRHNLGISHRDPVPPLVFRNTESELRVEFQYGGLAVVYTEPGSYLVADATALPLEGLADIAGPSQTPVRLVEVGSERIVAVYVSAGTERRHEYAIPRVSTLESFPAIPRVWTPCPASLVVALTTFARAPGNDLTTDPDNEAKRLPTVSALSRLVGGQVLLVGTTRTHVAVRSGPWTMLVPNRARVYTRTTPAPEPERARNERSGEQEPGQ